MKILFVHDHKFRYSGGGYYSNGAFPASVWQRYFSVFGKLTVVGRDGGGLGRADKGYTKSSVDEVRFCLMPNMSNLQGFLFGNKQVSKAIRSLVGQHDAVIARLPSRLGTLFIKEAIKQGRPYAVEVVACPWDALWNYGNWKGKVLAPFAKFNLRRIVASSSFTLYVTKDFLQRRYPSKSGVTTFCSNVEIMPVANEILHKRLIRIKNDKEVITFGLIGNYSSRYKGIDVAIRALALADHQLPNWELQILGAGDPRYYMDLAGSLGIAKKVNFVGSKTSGGAVYDWLDGVDCYLQPSFQEGLPRALVEAMSRGCPALATYVAGIPELLQPSEMVKPGDYTELSRLITQLVKDRDRCLALANRNFSVAKEYYKSVLDERRTLFWRSFQSHIETFR